MMSSGFDASLLEFAATAAALNARALDRAGLLDDFERGTMHVMIDFAVSHAKLSGDEEKLKIARSVRGCLPADTENPL